MFTTIEVLVISGVSSILIGLFAHYLGFKQGILVGAHGTVKALGDHGLINVQKMAEVVAKLEARRM